MNYVGLNTQIWRNNIKSIALLVLFPVLIFMLVWLFFFFIRNQSRTKDLLYQPVFSEIYSLDIRGQLFLWLIIAYLLPFGHDQESNRFGSA